MARTADCARTAGRLCVCRRAVHTNRRIGIWQRSVGLALFSQSLDHASLTKPGQFLGIDLEKFFEDLHRVFA